MENDKKSFVFMLDWIPIISLLDTREEIVELFAAIESLIKGEEFNISHRKTNQAWRFIMPKIVDNMTKYNQAKEKRLEALRKYNERKKDERNVNDTSTQRQRNVNDTSTHNVTVTDTVTGTVTGTVTVTGSPKGEFIDVGNSKGEQSSRFVRPNLEDIEQFIIDNSYDGLVSAESFFNYYESNGWKVGKSQMKDWRAAVRSWASRERKARADQTDSFMSPKYDDVFGGGELVSEC